MVAEHQRPVHRRDVDLADRRVRRVADLDARAVAQLHGLPRQREHRRDQRLAGDACRGRRQNHKRHHQPGRRHPVEHVLGSLRMLQQQGALPEVVQHQPGKHHPEPRQTNRAGAEMAHVGIQRLAAGDDEEHRAEDDEAVIAVGREEPGRRGPGSPQSARAARAAIQRTPSTASIDEPHTSSPGPNIAPMLAVPRYCTRNSRQQNRHRHAARHTAQTPASIVLSPSTAPSTVMAGVITPSPYSNAAPNRPRPSSTPRLCGPLVGGRNLRHQRHDAALAVVVGAHHVADVLARDDDDQRPEDQRQHAQHVVVGRRARRARRENTRAGSRGGWCRCRQRRRRAPQGSGLLGRRSGET